MNRNVEAFLSMISWAELGSEILETSNNGYNVLVGSLPGRLRLFASYDDHPRILVRVNDRLESTAAGRYQIRRAIFDAYRVQLNLKDFTPESQDKIALQLISECGAMPSINCGDISTAIAMVRSRWASMPGAGYKQHEHSYDDLLLAYVKAGGELR